MSLRVRATASWLVIPGGLSTSSTPLAVVLGAVPGAVLDAALGAVTGAALGAALGAGLGAALTYPIVPASPCAPTRARGPE